MTRAPKATAAVILATLVASLSASACSLGNRQAMANRVIDAVHRVEAAGTARGTITIEAQVIRSKLPVVPGPPRIVNGVAPNLQTVIDFKDDKAAVGLAGDDPASAAMVFDGTRVFQRRDVKVPHDAVTAGAASNLLPLVATAKAGPPPPAAPPQQEPPPPPPPPADQPAAPGTSRLHRAPKIERRWLTFDYAALAKRDTTKTAGSFAISPLFLTRLAAGTLTGSVHLAGPGHYAMNVSRDKAERRLTEDQRKELDKVFRANAIGGRVFKAQAWIDETGKLKQFVVQLRQSLSRTDRDDLHITLELTSVGAPITITAPDPKQTAGVANLGQLVHGTVGA